MSGSVNKVIIVGNIGADPEVIQLDQSRNACRLTVATHRQSKDRETGEKKQDVQWHRVVVFDQNAANFAKTYLKRGSLVYLEGQLPRAIQKTLVPAVIYQQCKNKRDW